MGEFYRLHELLKLYSVVWLYVVCMYIHILVGKSVSCVRFSEGPVAQRGLRTIYLRTSGSSMEFWEPPFDSATDLGWCGLGQLQPAVTKHTVPGAGDRVAESTRLPQRSSGCKGGVDIYVEAAISQVPE